MANTFKTYPSGYVFRNPNKMMLTADIYGNRFHADQTLYEYLIEFLLIFVSGDDDSSNPKSKLAFHNPEAKGNLYYTVEPRMGLRRFIFFDRNKKTESIEIDRRAYDELIKELKKYLPQYDKTEQFLSNQKWVEDMSGEGKMEQACESADKTDITCESYTNVQKVFLLI